MSGELPRSSRTAFTTQRDTIVLQVAHDMLVVAAAHCFVQHHRCIKAAMLGRHC